LDPALLDALDVALGGEEAVWNILLDIRQQHIAIMNLKD
jgi:hypothetical protein